MGFSAEWDGEVASGVAFKRIEGGLLVRDTRGSGIVFVPETTSEVADAVFTIAWCLKFLCWLAVAVSAMAAIKAFR